MGQLSLTHLIILTVIVLLVFGPSKLPQLGQSLGKAIRGFKQGLNEIDAESKDVTPPEQISQTQSQNQNASQAKQQTQQEQKDPTHKS